MSRILFVPQYPTRMRYQEWWISEFSKEFHKAGLDVYVLGVEKLNEMQKRRGDPSMFSPINDAIEFECSQIEEYMKLELKPDDILFVADISFPGFFTSALFHKRPHRAFAYCHATSLNIMDYFESVRKSKFAVETAHALMYDVVFVGSNYHDDKLGWPNTMVVRLPYPPVFDQFKDAEFKKTIDVISASRDNPQKIDSELEKKVAEKFGPIQRPITNSWFNYAWNLNSAKILLITSFEDTFGYQIVDAVMNNCIPLAPIRCAYPEILPREYLYEDEDELIRKIDYLLNSDHGVPYLSDAPYEVPVPKLLCDQEMKDFYKNIIQVMKGEVEPDYPF